MTSSGWRIDASTASLGKLADELRGYFRSRVNDTRDISDLVAQTWLAAGRTFEGRSSLRYYLYAVAGRLLSNYWGRKRHRPWIYLERDDPETLSAEAPALDTTLSHQREVARLHRAIAQLPAHYAAIIELSLAGYGHVAIAEQLGINYNTVRSRYNRGLAQLQRLLAGSR
jgi:RNA polymerase sigma factor (sigma-70 family)